MNESTRYCGDVKIELRYLGQVQDRLQFSAKVTLGPDWWEYDQVLVARDAPTPEAFDIAAAGIIHYGCKYGSDFDPEVDGEIPDWAPPTDFADAINDACDYDDRGFRIRREWTGPITYSG